jgi:hypothetical protein
MLNRDQTLRPKTKRALHHLSPALLKLQLETCLARAAEEFEAAAWELVKVAQAAYNEDLGDLLESAQAFPPNKLANLLVEFNPDLNFQDLPKLPPLEPVKAFLRVLTADFGLFRALI